MRVLIDTSYAARGPSGTAVYLERLIAALRERGEVEVVEAAQPRRLPRGNPFRSAANAVLDFAWLHGGLPRAARRGRADVVHHPLPTHSRRIGVPQVATVHDLAFLTQPAGYGRVWGRLAARAYRRASEHCAALVCVSHETARQVHADRVVVAHHGPGQVEGIELRTAPRTHLLYVGDAEARKNVDGLLAAYAVYRAAVAKPLDLVLAGSSARLAGAEGVRGVEEPAPEVLLALYASAVALVHPSLHEGFGLTVLEALALGTPVVAVAAPGTSEIAGDAALLTDPGGLAEAIERVAGDASLRERLAAAGRERAREFSWERSARAHERAYTLAGSG